MWLESILIVIFHLEIRKQPNHLFVYSSTNLRKFGVLKTTGTRNYAIVNRWDAVRDREEKNQFLITINFLFFFVSGCYGCWCPCCLGCDIGKYTGEGKCIGCCVCCTLEHMRTKLRVARRIEVRQRIRDWLIFSSIERMKMFSFLFNQGSCCEDCCTARCCFPCVMVQMSRELESQGLWDPPKESQPKAKPRS